MTDAYGKLERQFDGPIPQEELDILRHGSRQGAEIAKLEDSMWLLRDECRRMMKSARRWLWHGNREMHDHNRADAKFYLTQWKHANGRRNMLRADLADSANAARVFGLINQVTDGEATE